MTEFCVLVEPTAKGRPRVSVVGGHARAYTPAKTRNAEALIVASIREELKGLPQAWLTDGDIPLRLSVTFYRARPAHLPKRKTMPVSRPDVDNYLKTLLDALNGYAFKDDSQITTIMARKRYCKEGTTPRIEFTLTDDSE